MGNMISGILKRIYRYRLRDKSFVIISNNCWGAEIYRTLNRQYNTPFVGLFLFGPCYIKLIENFDVYLSQNLLFKDKSIYFDKKPTYPVGCLNDIEIHFMHYKNEQEAVEKWQRRLERMKKEVDKDNYYYKICDRDGATKDIVDRFLRLPLKNKISFGIENNNSSDHILIKNKGNNKEVPDGATLYQISYKYVDILGWIISGKKRKSFYSFIKNFAGVRI